MRNPAQPATICLVLGDDRQRIAATVSELYEGVPCRVLAPMEPAPALEGVVAVILVAPGGPEELPRRLAEHALSRDRVQLIVALPRARASEAKAFILEGASVVALPVRAQDLEPLLRAAVDTRGVPARAASAKTPIPAGLGAMWGESAAMREIFASIERVARGNATVLVLGETGSGKEMAARALHACSPRASGPFVPINLSAIPRELVEDELFGHAAGAFTGSRGPRAGRVEAAQGGTLFLDEIGDLPLPVQVKLLRLLQERSYERVGETHARPADFRLVCATHRDLEALIDSGAFREDLYYRINVVQLVMPPLRERGDDVVVLASAFLSRTAEAAGIRVSLCDAAVEAIRRYHWPGNVRELLHTMERAVAMALDGDVIGPELVKPRKRRGPLAEITTDILSNDRGLDAALAEIERAVLEASLNRCQGNASRAAQMLKLPRQTLQHRLKKYGMT